MIPQNHIIQWKNVVPWQDNAQVEQDLILSRAIIELYSHELLQNSLVFRGGTALHKIYSQTQERYSEDLDFVQKEAGPIGDILKAIHSVLDPWLGQPRWKQTQGRVTLYYKYESEISPVRSMKVKIEINTRERFSYHDLVQVPFAIENSWFQGQAHVTTYSLEELMGTKMRALYQRKKGRDLFDLLVMIQNRPDLNHQEVVNCFLLYMDNEGRSISKTEYENNMALKLKDNIFLEDIKPLLSSSRTYFANEAYQVVYDKLISLLK